MPKYIAELFGTFVLVFIGMGSAVLGEARIGFTGIAFAFGLTLTALVYAIGPTSGCHINPAVTFGFLVAKKISARDALGYMAAQVAGAILGSAVLLAVARGGPSGYDVATGGLGANGYAAHSPGGYSMTSAFLIELVLTFTFVLVIFASTDVKAPKGFAGIAVGVALAVIHLVAIPVTNTSVNPARSIGPALFVGGWALRQLWLFTLVPLLGGAGAAWFYKALWRPDAPSRS